MSPTTCPSCDSANPDGFRFCGACGAALARTCPSCGAADSGSSRFCGNCGSPLAAERAQPAPAAGVLDERKVVTVLFADIEASTELATRLDPEDLRAVLQPFFDAMRSEIELHGGTVEKFIGDAVVGIFGAPIAHEDDPERATRAALAMHERLAELNLRLSATAGGDLAMRIGVNTGEVLVGTSGREHEGMVTGEAVNVAARLQAVAPPGSVVVGERTYIDVRDRFGFVALGEATLKGLARPIGAWRVAPGVEPAVTSLVRSPMVGRSEELGLLRLFYRRTLAERRPNVVLVLGSPGIGKSRLADEFAAHVRDVPDDGDVTRARVLTGRCVPYGDDGLTYWPLAEMLKREAGILHTDEPAVTLRKARNYLAAGLVDDDSSRLHDVLLSSIGVATATDPLAGTDSAAAQREILAAWCRFFEAACSDRPLLAIFEDIHWADPSLLALIEGLARRVHGPVLFLCLSRPEFAERRPDWGSSLPNSTRFGLSPLTDSESTSLVAHLLGESAPPEVLKVVLDRSEGNPFFAAELTRMLTEDGTLERREGRWQVARPITGALPSTVQSVIVSRLDLLQSDEKLALQHAAVVGRVFWRGGLSRLGVDGADAIDRLVQRGLVLEREGTTIAGDRELMFNHGLTRDVAYGSIPRARRRELHAAVTTWMEEMTRGRDEEFAELIAHHAERAGDASRTARYAMLAGHRHRRVFAADEAIRWYDRALVAADDITGEAASLLIGEVAVSRGDALEQLGRLEDARKDYERALEVARNAGEERRWLEARALAAIVHVLWLEDRYDESRQLLPVALESARVGGQPDLEIRLLCTQGTIAFGSNELEESIALRTSALRIAEEVGDLEGEALAHHGLAECRLILGPLIDGLAHAERADTLLRRLGQRPILHENQSVAAWLRWRSGDVDEAEALARAASIGSRELGNRRDEGAALAIRALIALIRSELATAHQSALESVAAAEEVGAPRLELTARAALACVLAELNLLDALRENLVAWLRAAHGIEGVAPGRVATVRGWLQALDGEPGAAALFDEASRLSEERPHDQLMSAWAEVLCFEHLRDAAALGRAGSRLADLETQGGVFEGWRGYAQAGAAALRGDMDLVIRLTEPLVAQWQDGAVGWRLHALLASASEVAGRQDDARRHRAQLASLVARMVEGLDPVASAALRRRSELREVAADAANAAQA